MFAAAALGARPGAGSTGSSGASLGLGPGDTQRAINLGGMSIRNKNIRKLINYLEIISKTPSEFIGNREKGFFLWNHPEITKLTVSQNNAIHNMKQKLEKLYIGDPEAEAFDTDITTGEIPALYYLQWFLYNLDRGGRLPGVSNPKVITFWQHNYSGPTCGRGGICSWFSGSGRSNIRKSKSQRSKKSQRKTSQRKRKSRRN